MTRRLMLLGLLLAAVPAVAGPPGKSAPSRCVTVTFLHRDVRCRDCLRMEQWGREAVVSSFAPELASGAMAWRVANLDTGGNLRLKHEYSLRTSSLVLVETSGGKRVRWSRLDGAWGMLESRRAFATYVTASIRSFRREQGPSAAP
jgi:hypothetical protein